MRKWILALLALFTCFTVAFTTGCGGPKLEGKWIAQGHENWSGNEICLIMDIQKVKGTDNDYTLLLRDEKYLKNGNNFVWTKGDSNAPFPVTYDKEKQMLSPKEASMKGLDFNYKDGKWTMPATWILGGPYVFEEYSDSTLEKMQKKCQEIIKKDYGDTVKFYNQNKK